MTAGMTGIFPTPTGVPPGGADNAYTPANAPIGCAPMYYGPDCETLNYAWAMNAIVSEILAALDRLGYAYNCGRIDNLGAALADVIGGINARIAANTASAVAQGQRLDAAEADIDKLQTDVTTIQNTVVAMGNDITAIQTYLTNLDATQVKLNPGFGSMTNVQEALTAMWAVAAPMPAGTLKGNNAGTTSTPLNLTGTEVAAMLPLSSPSGKGLLPTLSGDVNQVFLGNGTWGTVPGQQSLCVISQTPPANPPVGQLWYESDTGMFLIRYADVDSQQWVQVNPSPQGVPEAPLDSQSYVRKSGGWAVAQTGAAIGEPPTDGRLYGRGGTTPGWGAVLPLAGGTLTGPVAGVSLSVTQVAGAGSGTYSILGQATANGGGVIGLNAAGNYGILGYPGYGLLVSGEASISGNLSMGSYTLSTGTIQSSGNLNLNSGGNVTSYGGVIQVNAGSVNFQFGSPQWNAINVTNSGYYIYFAYAGTLRYGLATDRWAPLVGNPLLGSNSQRWGVLYTTGNPNVSSDAKLKTDVQPFTAEEIACAKKIFPLLRTFKLISEGETGKRRAGVIAQDLETLFAAEGLNIEDYAFYQKDEDFESTTNEEGFPVETPLGTHTRSIVYSELLVWMMAAVATVLAGA